jgi:2-oxoglutarate dehydrogenase E2 component (dihydrolipoamide succinyltransferase)
VTSGAILGVIEEGAAASTSSAAKPAAPAASAKPADKSAAASAAASVNELSPAGRRVAVEEKIDPSQVSASGRGGRVTKEDLVNYAKAPTSAPAKASAAPTPGSRPEERVPMTRMRTRIAERLMQSKNSIAMLTSFNEVNLGQGHGNAQGAGRAVREGQRHQARLHELLRQGRRQRVASATRS